MEGLEALENGLRARLLVPVMCFVKALVKEQVEVGV